MKKLLIDVSSVLWMSLLAGKDQEYGKVVEHEGKQVHVNGWQFGLECAISHITLVMRELSLVPNQLIFVVEGKMSKSRRKAIYDGYKEGRGSRPPESYDEFNRCKDELVAAFRNVGAQAVTQDGVEADDVIAFLAKNLEGEKVILSQDGDLAALICKNVFMWRHGRLLTENPFGPFPCNKIGVFKALVGDSSDNIKGCPGFGEKAFLDFLVWGGDAGLAAIEGMILRRTLHELEDDVKEFKPMRKIIDGAESVYKSYECALLHPEWVDTLRQPLLWQAGMVRGRDVVTDSRLQPFAQQVRLVTADNYDAAVAFLKTKIDESEFFCLDLETTVPEESDEWLAQRSTKGGGVDVIASTIVGCGITFGNNQQYGYYCSVDHTYTANITLAQLQALLELFPKDKLTVAHNAAGFELPVMYNAFGSAWGSNGWRGFFPNMVDSRIAASYWNENAPSHGLKQLSKSLLDYEQVSYEQVTAKTNEDGTTYQVKMNGLTAAETIAYGLDDVFCTVGIWNFFRTVMELEKSYGAFLRVEQKPMYLSALSYVQGTPVSLERLFRLKAEDEAAFIAHEKVLHAYLIEKGWSGTQCPVITELTPALVKEAVQIILGQPLETAVRTISKMAKLIELLEHDDAPLLAQYVAEGNIRQINDWMAQRFDGTPDLNVGSNKQLVTLMYETMGLPIRLRNKPTDVMRAKGIREGNPRADDDAMSMAIKMGDASPEVAPVLEALTSMKSINTKMGLYWNAYPNMCHWTDGRLHPEFRQCSTNTRRHSASSPNLQQMDSTPGGVRSVIMPHRKNAVILSLDESGQEVRLAADYSKDKNLSLCFVGSKDQLRDVHSMVACKIAGVTYDEFAQMRKSEDPEVALKADRIRHTAKTCVFASFYGAMAPKIAESLGISESEAQTYIDAIYTEFHGLSAWKTGVENFASKNGYVDIKGGGRRHLRDALIGDDKWVAQKALRQASNASIQAAGGNQIRTVMGRIWDSDLIDSYDFQFYWPLHDEIVVSVSAESAPEVIGKLHSFMVEPFLDVIPSASSIGIGRTYGDLIKIGEAPDIDKINGVLSQIFDKEAATV